MIKTDQENIQVLVRIRPLNSREKAEGATPCMQVDKSNPTTVIIDGKSYNYDYITGSETTQEDIFHIVGKPVALAWLEGYNACIFAYGQTGAGKTFTMQGKGLIEEGAESPNRGLQPRVFDYVFGLINSLKKENPENEYLITCNYLEIYNEQIMDLLAEQKHDANAKPVQLSVREDLKKGVYVENLCEEVANSSEDAINLLIKGASARHVGATKMNADSSRSHSVFSLNFQSKIVSNGMIHVKNSKLHFVDLAGSERQKSTGAAGDRLKEASNINKSLTVLGLVINALVESANGKSRHIPYRDSKLTFILKDSLGGNSRTFMIAACSEANTQFQETLSTLKFAQRAKMIKNKASVNEESQGNVQQLKKEIQKLKEELQDAKKALQEMEENQKNMTRIITPAKYTPTSMNHEAVIQFQQKNFKEINIKLEEVNQLLSDFNDSRSRIEEFFKNEKLGVLRVFQDIVDQKKMGQDVDIIKALTQKSDMEEEGISSLLTEIDQTIVEDIQQMTQTCIKLEEFEERRKDFTSKLEKIGLMNFGCPEKEKELEEAIIQREKRIIELQNEQAHQNKLFNQQLEEISNQRDHFKEVNQGLNSEIQSLQQQIAKNVQTHEEKIQQFKNGFESKLAEYDQNSSEIKIKNMELADEIDELKSHIENLNRIKDDIKQKWENAYENYQKTLQTKNEIENQKDSIQSQLNISREENTNLMFKLSEAENLYNQDRLHMMTLEDELNSQKNIIQEKDHQINNLVSRIEEENLRLQATIDKQKDDIASLEDQITKSKEDIEIACQTLEFLNKQLEEKCQVNIQLQETYKQEFNQREKFENELKYLYHNEKSQLNVALKQNEIFEKQIQEIEQEITQKMDKITDLEHDILGLQEKLKNNEKRLNSLEVEKEYYRNETEQQIQQIQIKDDKIKEINQALETALQMGEQLEMGVQEYEKQNKILSEQLLQKEQEILEKILQLEDAEQKIRVSQMTHELLTQKISELESQLGEQITLNTGFQDQIVLLSEEKKDLIQKEAQLIESNLEQEKTIIELKENLQQLEQLCKEKETQIEQIKSDFYELKKSSEDYQQIQDHELKSVKEQNNKLNEQVQNYEFEVQNMQQKASQMEEDMEVLKQEIQEKQELYLQSEKSKEEQISQKNQKIEELIQERQVYEEEFDKIQTKYSNQMRNISELQQSFQAARTENESIKKQIEDNRGQMEIFQLEKQKFEIEKQKLETERQTIQQEMYQKDILIQKFKEEQEQIGCKFEIFKTLHEQIEEQKNVYQSKYVNKSKELDNYEQKYNTLEQAMERLNEKLTIKQLENNKLTNQILIMQSNREKNQFTQEDLQRDLKKSREECSQIKQKYKALILERQVQSQQANRFNGNANDQNIIIKKLEEENNKIKDQFNKYKQISEKKINEICEKLNRGISTATIVKDISNSTEIAKKLEKQCEIINEKNMGILEINILVRNYLIDCKKGQIDPTQKDEYLEKIQSQEDTTALKEVLSSVLKSVEERERKVQQEMYQLKEKKASYEYYRSKCEELEFRYEKKNSETGEKILNRKRKLSVKENEVPILGEIDLNKKVKANF
ncbi:kinesin motor catalytic domain protein (macronuclear) [Tetrahymena thermophila SB210]|uniref:Kinesin motor catalytic domain protein n=1 Tax=Tetrahymena thermophila (strain SB210) TaxID=312017 RepID=I7M1B1_TETTS|nr:kinesin motor catalytic domain protein [Tetrahymena thermophila SB210]EAR95984.2 kinesin motor catalytic domain protein [Tetrahymena thermophila SB210]|eukprot:XP_001016229.2 kinesin motor catalytic domain protein [Tetrahymena thermophila SB210]